MDVEHHQQLQQQHQHQQQAPLQTPQQAPPSNIALPAPGEMLPRIAEEKDSPTSSHEDRSVTDGFMHTIKELDGENSESSDVRPMDIEMDLDSTTDPSQQQKTQPEEHQQTTQHQHQLQQHQMLTKENLEKISMNSEMSQGNNNCYVIYA